MGPIHLFEPGKSGHRPVIARYTAKCLRQSGIPYFFDETPLDLDENVLKQLDRRAQGNGCTMTHVLTLEGHFGRFIRDGACYRKKIPLVGNYYLYSNLKSTMKSAAINLAMHQADLRRILVSDEKRDNYRWGLEQKTDYVVDPWDPDEFPKLEKVEARTILGLGNTRTIFLLFGSLSERKGARLVLEALQRAGFPDKVLVLLAGKPEESLRASVQTIEQQAGDSLRCDFNFIPEHLVSAYFHAADYVLSAYPAWFQVSSGTFTRACAAGRPSIVGDLGALADHVTKNNCGLTYETESADALAALLIQFSTPGGNTRYSKWSSNASLLSLASVLTKYGDQLVNSYKKALLT